MRLKNESLQTVINENEKTLNEMGNKLSDTKLELEISKETQNKLIPGSWMEGKLLLWVFSKSF